MEIQKQSSGDDSLNLQANRDINISTGLTVQDAYAIAKSLFTDNFPILSETAQKVARERAEEIVEAFVDEFIKSNSDLQVIADPDFQYSLLTAQRDYARSGESDLKSTLVNLLVQRSHSNGSLEKVVLAEAIATVRKLTPRQVSALTVAWFVRSTSPIGQFTLDSFLKQVEVNLSPFVDSLPKSNSEYMHIQYSSCGTVLFGNNLGEAISSQLPGLFQRGFAQSSADERVWATLTNSGVVSQSTRDPGLWEMRYANEKLLKEALKPLSVDDHIDHIVSLFNIRLSADEVEQILVDRGSFWPQLIEAWNTGLLGKLSLSSVGMAIAHSNWSAKTADSAPLSFWITEEAPESA